MARFSGYERNNFRLEKLHDSELFLIETNKKYVKLGFRLSDGSIVFCYLHTIRHFLCDGMMHGNIILDLTIDEGECLSSNIRNRLFEPPKGDVIKFNKYVNSVEVRLKKGELKLVMINPSYGCEIIALCEEVEFMESKKIP